MVSYLIAADPMETFLPATDTTTLLAYELLRRGIAVDYLDLSRMDWRQPPGQYLSHLNVAPIEEVFLNDQPPFRLGPRGLERVQKYSVILQRKDPPVDELFVGHCKAFSDAPHNILQINDPQNTWRVSEHELPLSFPEYSLGTCVVTSRDELIDTIRKTAGVLVVKPSNTYSGWGIEFFSRNTTTEELNRYWDRWAVNGGRIVLQEYAPEIETIGDLRVLVMNARIIGSVLRKPKPGSRLANLHQGASAHPYTLSPRQKKASLAIAEEMAHQGLLLLGIDFIGERVSEINVTCPSALRQINWVEKIEGQVSLIDEIEKLRASRAL